MLSNHNEPCVLIVDDDESVVETLQEVLQRDGYQVMATGAASAVGALLERAEFEAAIIDLRLGASNGIDVLKMLRDRQPDCAGIVLTGYASMETAIAAVREGVYDYLTKPCNLNELKLALARAAERNFLRRALRERIAELEAANRRTQEMAGEMEQELQRQVRERTEALEKANEELRREIEQRKEAENTILQLSTPVLQLHERLLLVTVVGALTAERARRMTGDLLAAVRRRRTLVVVMDLTGLAGVDASAAHELVTLMKTVRFLGAWTIVTGISAAMSNVLMQAGVDLPEFWTAHDLQTGIEEATRLLATRKSLGQAQVF